MARPMFRYFGGKWNKAKHYGPPTRRILVEPFAGAANYALYWDWKDVILVEKDPVIYGIWDWLINEACPEDFDLVPDDNWRRQDIGADVPEPLKDLVGLWYHLGSPKPRPAMTPSSRDARDNNGYKSMWGANIKSRMKTQLPLIKNWQVMHGDYSIAPDGSDCFSFIDPPYRYRGGKTYVCNNKGIDYGALGIWCKSRNAGVVCESIEADWMSFKPFMECVNQSLKTYTEAVYWINPEQPIYEEDI